MTVLAGLAAGTTIAAARRHLAKAFQNAGIDTPDLDARMLMGHALGLDHTALAIQADRTLTDRECAAIAQAVQRRLDHEPVARILGNAEFWGLPIALNAETLVPRPDTETVVQAALIAIDRGGPRARNLLIADLGTGSGALLLALLTELPNAYGVGTDLSIAALHCARSNARQLGLMARAGFLACDYATALTGPFDLVVSNPPYIRRGDIAGLSPEVRDFDPHRALDGGPDGLQGYRAIAADAARLVKPGGHVIVELGMGQRDSVAALFSLPVVETRADLAGIPRALTLTVTP